MSKRSSSSPSRSRFSSSSSTWRTWLAWRVVDAMAGAFEAQEFLDVVRQAGAGFASPAPAPATPVKDTGAR
jgi:hypothetical protein